MAEATGTREITLTRVFDAPRERVFTAWTDPVALGQWWGPDGFGTSEVISEPHAGGTLKIVMKGPDFEQTMNAIYKEVVAPEHIVVDSVVAGPDGQPFLESSHTVEFVDLSGKTEVTVHARATVFSAEALAALAGMQAGWSQSLQCLDDFLSGAADRQLVFTRLYEAPPEEVFPMWTNAEHLEKWWGPDGFSITIEEIDVRPGGSWKFTMHGPDGTDYPNTITYREVLPSERLVYDHGEIGNPDYFTSTVMFEEMSGNTVLSMRLSFADAGSRDLVVEKYHAEEGGHQTLDRLGALLGRSDVGAR
jgi:uncharacterized protein YndB with AHSA1/START domain